nr:hypothetical protein Iba_scaffold14336CG0170 [Ipomoea batatas]
MHARRKEIGILSNSHHTNSSLYMVWAKSGSKE